MHTKNWKGQKASAASIWLLMQALGSEMQGWSDLKNSV
jgi:hypothetical protein